MKQAHYDVQVRNQDTMRFLKWYGTTIMVTAVTTRSQSCIQGQVSPLQLLCFSVQYKLSKQGATGMHHKDERRRHSHG